ncbi:MAG: hypothetical protein ACLFQZ_07940, partial [Spirochaetaceae bacterium]
MKRTNNNSNGTFSWKRIIGLLLLAGFLVLAGCSESGAGDDSSSAAPSSPSETDVSTVENTASTAGTNAASAASDDPAAEGMANSMGELFTSFVGFIDDWDGEAYGWEEQGDTWVLDSGDGTFRWEVTQGSDRWTFRMYFDSALFYEGYVLFDGTAGEFTYYSDGTTVIASASWSTAADGAITFVYEADPYTVTVVTNSDGSAG